MLHTLSAPEIRALQSLAHRDLPRALEIGRAAGRRAQAEAFAGAFDGLRRRAASLLHRRRAAQGRARPAGLRVPYGYGA